MPRKVHDETTQSAFLRTVIAARAAGKPWIDALKAAKEAGYAGTLGGIKMVFREVKGKKGSHAEPQRGREEKPCKELCSAVSAPLRENKARRGRPKEKSPAAAAKWGDLSYDEATRAAIVNAALEAREAGKEWRQALAAAKAMGYRGGKISLRSLISRVAKSAGEPGRRGNKRRAGLSRYERLLSDWSRMESARRWARIARSWRR